MSLRYPFLIILMAFISATTFAEETVDGAVKTFVGMPFVWVAKGCFKRESHQLCLPQGYWLGQTEVTQGQWQAVMGSNPANFKNCGLTCPVEKVSWHDTQTFIKKLNRQGKGVFALPTDDQWEYACRKGDAPVSAKDTLNQRGWNVDNSRGKTHPVAEKTPNGLGLYDMRGNVWEWMAYSHEKSTRDQSKARSKTRLSRFRLFRGGSWNSRVSSWRCANNRSVTAGYRGYNLGFRVLKMSEDSLKPCRSVMGLKASTDISGDAKANY
jgi:formylglycine-generating enzyme required for sulfatase activity